MRNPKLRVACFTQVRPGLPCLCVWPVLRRAVAGSHSCRTPHPPPPAWPWAVPSSGLALLNTPLAHACCWRFDGRVGAAVSALLCVPCGCGCWRAFRRVQHHTAQLDLSVTPLELLQRTFPTAKVDELRAHLGRYGLVADLAVQTIGAW